jgi:Ca2+-binding RTX toxin-like protein
MRRRALFVAGLMVAALVVASGVAWAATISCPNRSGSLCVGTSQGDTMTGRDRADDMRGREGGDLMRGGAGADVMGGQEGADRVFGQDGPDTLTGGLGKDTLSGAKGEDRLTGAEGDDALGGGRADDTYVFPINDWGDDTITDTTNADNDPPDIDPLTGNFAEFGSPDQPLTTRLTVNLTSSASEPEVSNGTLTGTVNWSNNAIDGVYVGSITDDRIDGNAAANTIVANVGEDSDDTINAGAGNDWISVLDGAGGDSVDCGEGVDQVFSDTGDTLISC